MARMESPPLPGGNLVSDIHTEREVAFAMALHDRLGAGSSAAILQSQELADIICRKAKKPMLMVIGGKDATTNASIEGVECYDPDTQEWATMQPMPFPRRGLAAAAIQGRMYLMGGQYTGAYSSTDSPIFCRYHPNAMVQSCGDRRGDWRHEAPLPTARSYLAASEGEDEDGLYAIGGFEGSLGNRYLSTVERYSARRDEWTACADISSGRSHLAATTLNQSVFALGGYSDGHAWAEVERYDAGKDIWVKEAPMPTARDSLAAASLGGTHLKPCTTVVLRCKP
ncbi:hypothetical protein T484DRAFT_3409410 [Baffinella frigidus]|nr:hypothetical protein T484DRAFT_3409410 [Cryptophyta sp. CCMP2293]